MPFIKLFSVLLLGILIGIGLSISFAFHYGPVTKSSRRNLSTGEVVDIRNHLWIKKETTRPENELTKWIKEKSKSHKNLSYYNTHYRKTWFGFGIAGDQGIPNNMKFFSAANIYTSNLPPEIKTELLNEFLASLEELYLKYYTSQQVDVNLFLFDSAHHTKIINKINDLEHKNNGI